jgi:hypothetical protein
MSHDALVISIIAAVILVVLGALLWRLYKQRRFSKQMAAALGAEKSGRRMNATHNGISYHYHWNPGSRNSPPYLQVFVDCISSGRFRVIREGALERFFTKLGISRQIKTGDAAFDQEFYILSDETDFATGYFSDPQKRQAVSEIFAMGFTDVKHDGKIMEARLSPFKMSDEVDPAVITVPLASLNLLAAMPSTPFQYHPYELSPQGANFKMLRVVAFAVPILASIAAIVTLVWGMAVFEPLDAGALFLDSLKYSVPTLVLFLWLAVRWVRGRSGSHRELLVILGLSLVAFPLAGFGGQTSLNGWLDASPPVPHQTLVVKKHTTKNKNSTSYYVSLRSWRDARTTEKLSVHEALYNQVTPGKTVITAVTRAGHFGFEWWVSYRIAVGAALP